MTGGRASREPGHGERQSGFGQTKWALGTCTWGRGPEVLLTGEASCACGEAALHSQPPARWPGSCALARSQQVHTGRLPLPVRYFVLISVTGPREVPARSPTSCSEEQLSRSGARLAAFGKIGHKWS